MEPLESQGPLALTSELLFPPSGPGEDLSLHEIQPLPATPRVYKDGHVGQQVVPWKQEME